MTVEEGGDLSEGESLAVEEAEGPGEGGEEGHATDAVEQEPEDAEEPVLGSSDHGIGPEMPQHREEQPPAAWEPRPRPEVREVATMTPAVLVVEPKPRKAAASPVVQTGARKPKPEPPRYLLVAHPLVKLRETTQEEWEVEEVIEGLVTWAIDDHQRQMSRKSLERFTFSGQNVAFNTRYKNSLQRKTRSQLAIKQKKVEKRAKEALRRSKKPGEEDGEEEEEEDTAESKLRKAGRIPPPICLLSRCGQRVPC